MIKRQDPNLQKYKMAMHFFIIPKHCFALLVEREVRNVCQPKEIKNKSRTYGVVKSNTVSFVCFANM